MRNARDIQFLTLRYSRSQGLKGFPVGLLLLAIVLWVNYTSGPSRNLILPISFGLAAAGLYWLLNRYYRTRYGRVEGTFEQKRVDYLSAGLAGLAGLAAFLIDITYNLPVNAVGLIFAAGCILEYVRLYRLGNSSYFLWQSIISFILIFAVSILPLFVADKIWLHFGLRSHLLLVLLVTSVILLLGSVGEHLNFVRQFPAKEAEGG